MSKSEHQRMIVKETRVILRQMTEPISLAAKELSPEDFQIFFTAFLANIVGNLPDDYWQRMKVTEPCGLPDCTCHLEAKAALDGMEAIRNAHIKITTGKLN